MTFSNTHSNSVLKSREEAAELLRVSAQTLAVWACTKRYNLPFVKIGRRVMYRLSDLHAFIERNVVGGQVL